LRPDLGRLLRRIAGVAGIAQNADNERRLRIPMPAISAMPRAVGDPYKIRPWAISSNLSSTARAEVKKSSQG
jgi:hypothetical protein